MIMQRARRICVVLIWAASVAVSLAAPPSALQVGAAKVDITPAPDAALPMGGYGARTQGFQRIHDHIYVRAIVLSDGANQAVLLAWELIAMPTRVWEELSQRIAKELGIPAENQLLAGVHDHSAPTLAGSFGRPPTPGATPAAAPPGRAPSPGTIAYTTKVENDAVEAVRQAKANLQPAKFGVGTGTAYVNINRRELFPKDGWWWLGYNPEGPSDKTLAVVKFTDLAGKPIALFINYAVHAVVMGPDNLAVTGDLAGATSRYVEQYFQGKIPTRGDAGWELDAPPPDQSGGPGPVAVWTSGAAGDQNPVAMDRGEDFTMVDGLGRILGEESVRVANRIAVLTPQASISAAQRVITCPGRRLAPGPAPRASYNFEDADPVNIRLSLLKLNDVAFTGVSGEVFTHIFEHLKSQSPFNHTIMVTHANGSIAYIPSDDASEPISYENTASHLKPGCAETGIVNGLLEMMGGQ
jgi:neutral ceramidase